MKRILCVLLLASLLAVALLPAAATTATPFDASVAAAQTAVGACVGRDTVGAAVLLFEQGRPVMVDGFGYADLSTRALVTADTFFELGELSALFVALSALTLVDAGSLSLDADIANYLPAPFMAKLSLTYPVTTRQLLSGRAGLGGRMFDISFEKDSYCFETLEEALLSDIPAQFTTPGTAYSYSSFGIALVAFVIENITGISYEEYTAKQVLAPLGMTDTVLAFSKDSVPEKTATGYLFESEGMFTSPQNGGRSYAGLSPATGALSTAADLSRLLSWLLADQGVFLKDATKAQLFETFQSGIFSATALVLGTNGSICTLDAATTCFAASLRLDKAAGKAVLVLTNTAQNTLLSMSASMLAGAPVPLTLPLGEPAELKALRGTYALATSEQHTFVGRLATLQSRVTVTANEDGTLSFLDRRLVQIARGVFADAAGDNTPVLQFLFDGEGEVTAVITATGECYTKLPFYYARIPAAVLLGLLVVLAAQFILMGFVSLAGWLAERDHHGDRAPVRLLLPDLLAAILGILVGITALVAYNKGATALSSFYFAMQVLALLVGIGATVAYVIAFVSSVLDRKVHKRIAYMAIMYLAFVFLVCFWGLTVF